MYASPGLPCPSQPVAEETTEMKLTFQAGLRAIVDKDNTILAVDSDPAAAMERIKKGIERSGAKPPPLEDLTEVEIGGASIEVDAFAPVRKRLEKLRDSGALD